MKEHRREPATITVVTKWSTMVHSAILLFGLGPGDGVVTSVCVPVDKRYIYSNY